MEQTFRPSCTKATATTEWNYCKVKQDNFKVILFHKLEIITILMYRTLNLVKWKT